MNKEKKGGERGGGVQISPHLTRIREVINKNGDVVKSTVEEPKAKKEAQQIQKVSERLR